MDLEPIRQFFETDEGKYLAISASVLTAGITGYLVSKFSSGEKRLAAQRKHELDMASERTKQFELENIAAQNDLRAKELAYQDADAAHKRDLEISEIQRQRSLEDRAYRDEQNELQRKKDLEDRDYQKELEDAQNKRALEERTHEMAIVSQVRGYASQIRDFIAQHNKNLQSPDEELLKKRDALREEIYNGIKEDYDETTDGFYDAFSNDGVFDDSTRQNIEDAINTRYPLSESNGGLGVPIPKELKSLLKVAEKYS